MQEHKHWNQFMHVCKAKKDRDLQAAGRGREGEAGRWE